MYFRLRFIRSLTLSVLFVLSPLQVFAATSGSFSGGYAACYEDTDVIAATLTYTGSAGQVQVQMDSTDYSYNSGTLRFVLSNSAGSSPFTGNIVWADAFDGAPTYPFTVTAVRYYSSSGGFSADDTVNFTVQDTPCDTGSTATSTLASDITSYDPSQTLFNGMVLFLLTFFGLTFYFKRQTIMK